MSISILLKQVSSETLADFIAGKLDPDELFDLNSADSKSSQDSELDLDKSWHGIHFLLSGMDWEVRDVKTSAILGGTEHGDEFGYGPVRYLAVEQVQTIAKELQVVRMEQLQTEYDPARMSELEIYPDIWDDEIAKKYLLDYFAKLVQFYSNASNRKLAVLIAVI